MMGSPLLIPSWWGFVVCNNRVLAQHSLSTGCLNQPWSTNIDCVTHYYWWDDDLMAGWGRISCLLLAAGYSSMAWWCLLEKKQECIKTFLSTTALFRLIGLNVYVHLLLSSLKIQIQSIDCHSLYYAWCWCCHMMTIVIYTILVFLGFIGPGY
jgi:hypothetical protein